MLRPRPLPLPISLVVKKGSTALPRTSSVMPSPLSATEISTYSPGRRSGGVSLRLTLAVRIVKRPPAGIASRALIARFNKTSSICVGSTNEGQSPSVSTVSIRTVAPIVRNSRSPASLTSRFRSSDVGARCCLRENARSWCVSRAPRSAAVRAERNGRNDPSPFSRRSSNSKLPSTPVRRLLKSCATPEVSCPIASSFCDWRSASSVCCRSAISAGNRSFAAARLRVRSATRRSSSSRPRVKVSRASTMSVMSVQVPNHLTIRPPSRTGVPRALNQRYWPSARRILSSASYSSCPFTAAIQRSRIRGMTALVERGEPALLFLRDPGVFKPLATEIIPLAIRPAGPDQLRQCFGQRAVAPLARRQGDESIMDLVLAPARPQRRAHRAHQGRCSHRPLEQGQITRLLQRVAFLADSLGRGARLQQDDEREVRPGGLLRHPLDKPACVTSDQRLFSDDGGTGALEEVLLQVVEIGAPEGFDTGSV